MPEPALVEALARALRKLGVEDGPLAAEFVAVELATLTEFTIIPTASIREAWSDDWHLPVWHVYSELIEMPGDVRVIVAPDPRTEATDE